MNKNEVVDLLGIVTANFPRLQEKEMKPTAVLWEMSLSDMPYEVAKKAIIKVLSTNKFFPTVAEIRAAAVEMTQPRGMDAMEAWHKITEAIRKYGYTRQEEGLSSLPNDVRQMAERFGWRELCLNENPDTLRAQFRMAWDQASKRQNEFKVLPENIQDAISDQSDGMKMIGEK